MAGNEAEHCEQLSTRRQQLFGDAPRRVSAGMISEEEAPSYGAVHVYTSPRQAMEVAVQSEKKAHAFFTEALSHVEDPDVRALFEELRAEEMQHQALLEQHLEAFPPGPDLEPEGADEPPAL